MAFGWFKRRPKDVAPEGGDTASVQEGVEGVEQTPSDPWTGILSSEPEPQPEAEQQPVEQPAEQPAEQPVEQPAAEQPAEQPAVEPEPEEPKKRRFPWPVTSRKKAQDFGQQELAPLPEPGPFPEQAVVTPQPAAQPLPQAQPAPEVPPREDAAVVSGPPDAMPAITGPLPAISEEPLWSPSETRMFGQPLPPEPPVTQDEPPPLAPVFAGEDGLIEPIPTSFWERLAEHPMLISAAAVFLLALMAAVVYAALTPSRPLGVSQQNVATEPTATPVKGPTPGLTAGQTPATSINTSSSPSTSSTAFYSALPIGGRAALIAYRQEGWLWVARENGGDSKKVVQQSSGEFALSPDGRTLASIDGMQRILTLTDVATGQSTKPGRAQAETPAWAPDSSFLVYVERASADYRVRRINRDGSNMQDLAEGRHPKLSRDGAVVGFLRGVNADQVGTFYTLRTGEAAKKIADNVSDFAFGPDRIFYGKDSSAGTSITSVKLDGTDAQAVRGKATQQHTVYSRMFVSPDGSWLTFAETGDDGLSKMYTIRRDGTKLTLISKRWDDYPMGWVLGGGQVLFTQGNALQAEKTSVCTVNPDGSLLQTIVKGAGL